MKRPTPIKRVERPKSPSQRVNLDQNIRQTATMTINRSVIRHCRDRLLLYRIRRRGYDLKRASGERGPNLLTARRRRRTVHFLYISEMEKKKRWTLETRINGELGGRAISRRSIVIRGVCGVFFAKTRRDRFPSGRIRVRVG